MFEQKITFDRLIRWIITALIIIAVIFVIDYLSNVLLPFFVAWLLAYIIHPLVKFTQYKLHVPTRALSIVVTLIFIIAVIFGVCYLIFPPMIEQFEKLGVLITRYVQDKTDTNNISQAIQEWLRENNQQIQDLLKQKDVTDAIKSLRPECSTCSGRPPTS